MSLVNPITAAFLLALGFAVFYFFALPGDQQIDVTSADSPLNLKERLVRSLRAAGIFEQAPSIVLVFLALATTILALLLFETTGTLWSVPGAVALVFFGVQWFLHSRQRAFMSRAHDELIPFLNRISTSVGAGVPLQAAYLQAVEDSNVLKEVLEDSAAKIASGYNFSEALLETLPLLPLRMWAVFVRQMEHYEEVGGDVKSTIQSTVVHINKMLQLQAETRADYAIQAKQQQLIIFILLAGFLGMVFIVPNGKEMFHTLITTTGGIVGLTAGVSIIIFGLWFLNKQLRDVERKMAF